MIPSRVFLWLALVLALLAQSACATHNAVVASRIIRRARAVREQREAMLEEPRFLPKTDEMRPPDELTALQGTCREEFDCSAGCIAVVGNGWSMTRGQAAMAIQCDRVYRANFMDSAHTCAKRATHCFHHWIPEGGFVAIRKEQAPKPSTFGRGSQALRLNIKCDNMVWENGELSDYNMTWDGPSEAFSSADVKETMEQYWDNSELVNGRQPKNLWRKPSSGMYMIAHALKNQGDKCVHIFGFNFWVKAGTGQKSDHPFAEEQRLVQRMLRMRERVFFHPMLPVDARHKKGQLHYGM